MEAGMTALKFSSLGFPRLPLANGTCQLSGRRSLISDRLPGERVLLMILAAVLIFAAFGRSFGQAGIDTGSVTGTIKDASGALVPAANATLTNTATGVTQKRISTHAGAYSFPLVPVGTYSLNVQAKGFETSVVNQIVVVHLGTTVTEDVDLQVGKVSAEVTVTSAAPLLQAQDASFGTIISNEAIAELPIFGAAAAGTSWTWLRSRRASNLRAAIRQQARFSSTACR